MSAQHNITVFDYYTQQSAITDPISYAALFDNLPHDISSLMKIVQGLLVFPYAGWAQHYKIQVVEERGAELRLRTIPKMLERILALDPSPLSILRTVTNLNFYSTEKVKFMPVLSIFHARLKSASMDFVVTLLYCWLPYSDIKVYRHESELASPLTLTQTGIGINEVASLSLLQADDYLTNLFNRQP